jgi:transposase
MGDRRRIRPGAPLTARLRADGVDLVDVPAKLAARVRILSTGHGRKNDDADAVSVGIAARSARTLTSVTVEGTVTALRAIVDHRDNLVKTRTQTVNRLHVVLTNLIPAGAKRDLTADQASELLRRIRPRDTAGKILRGLAVDLVTEIRHLDRRIARAVADIQAAVTASGTTLTELCGIGALTAGKILGRVGTIDRFHSAAAFASYNGTAPIDVSSGDVIRHRLPAPATVNSTSVYMSWPSPKSGRTPRAGSITCGNERRARATKKRCDASTAAVRRRLPPTAQ